jgi:hypothetical protein
MPSIDATKPEPLELTVPSGREYIPAVVTKLTSLAANVSAGRLRLALVAEPVTR